MSVLRSRSHRNYFSKHPQAVTEKANFASFSVVPADRNFSNAQSGAVRKEKQLNIEGETIEPRRLQNRPANVEPERLEPALRVPKWQTGCDPHKEIESTSCLFPPPRLVNPD